MYFSPRKCSLGLLVILFSFINTSIPLFAATKKNKPTTVIQKQLAELEASSGGRIGIYAINTANNGRIQYRAQEHFPFQSTFKIIGVSAVLKQSINNNHLLQQKVTYKKRDLVFWSPITTKHIGDGMTISELCQAAMQFSDNTAINLLMKKLGGPKAVTSFSRSIGDNSFRLDNWEPELNSNPNDLHDTTTPVAMGTSLKKLALGNTLALPQRELLQSWLKNNTTGDARIRAGVPKGWVVGEKTGSGDYGIANDIGIIWPPKCSPIVITIFFNQKNKEAARREEIIASATRLLLKTFAQNDQCIQINN